MPRRDSLNSLWYDLGQCGGGKKDSEIFQIGLDLTRVQYDAGASSLKVLYYL